MEYTKKISLAIFFTLSLLHTAHATICSDGTIGTSVFYVNGVDNDLTKTIQSTIELSKSLRKFIADHPLQSGCLVKLGYAYNQTQGKFLDLYESYAQIEDDIPLFWRILSHILLAPVEISTGITNFILGIDLNSFVLLDDLESHVAKYASEILDENKVVAVAHSQGNLYANDAHNLLFHSPNPIEDGTFSIVSVATPAGFVAGYEQGEKPYTTLEGDFIHRVPGALNWNISKISHGDCGSVWDCHAFVNTYLNGEVSGTQIIEHIVDAITAAVEPVPVFNFGPVNQLSTNSGILENPQIVISGSSIHTVWADDDIAPSGAFLGSNLFYRRSPDGGISFDHIQNLSTGASVILNSPDVAADGSRVFVVWCRNGVLLRRSTDGGATFAEPVLPLGSGCNPQIVGRGLLVAVVWEDGDAFLRRSTDGGDSFEPAVNLSNGRGGISPSLAVSGSTVAVVWRESELIDPEEEIFIHTIVFRSSTDSGATFNPVQNISDTTDFPLPHVAASNQTIGIVWEETDPSTGDTPLPFYRGSLDGGITFSSIKNLSDGIPGVGPVVATDGCVIHTAWLSLTEPRHIAYRRSTDCGVTFDPIQEFPASLPLPGHPQLVVHESRVALIWQETEIQNLRSDIFFAGSIDDGVTFSEPQNVSETNGSSILNGGPGVHQVGLSDAIVAVVWMDDTPGNREVFISSADVPQ